MITGKNLVAGNWEHSESSAVFQTVNPKTKTALGINHQEATTIQIETAVQAAASSFEVFAESSFEDRAIFLKTIQEELQQQKSEILSSYQEESALPEGRAEGEFQRTISQIQSFIELMDNGSFSEVKIHTQGPDLRKMNFLWT